MAWLFGDGFDFYDTTGAHSASDMTKTGSVWSVSNCNCYSTNISRYGLGGFVSMGNYNSITSVPFTNSTTVWLNFAGMTNGQNAGTGFLPNSGGVREVSYSFLDINTVQCSFCFTQNGNMLIRTGGNVSGSIIASSPVIDQLTNDVWNHFQVKLVIDHTAGSIEVRMNGDLTPIWAVSGINTRNGTGNAYCNKLLVNTPNSAFYGWFVDDLYMFNDQGADPKDWQGDVRCYPTNPNSDVSTMWTPNTGANNYSRVNEFSENQDTSYVYSSTPGDNDFYTINPIPTSYPLVCVQPKIHYRMDDAGPHRVTHQLKSGATTVNGASGITTSNYTWLQTPYVVDPNTSVAWIASDVNLVNLGPLLIS